MLEVIRKLESVQLHIPKLSPDKVQMEVIHAQIKDQLTDVHGYISKLIKSNSLIGRLGGMSTSSLEYRTMVRLAEASHRISNLVYDGNDNLTGDIEILDTPKGRCLDHLLGVYKDEIRFVMRALFSPADKRLYVETFDAVMR